MNTSRKNSRSVSTIKKLVCNLKKMHPKATDISSIVKNDRLVAFKFRTETNGEFLIQKISI